MDGFEEIGKVDDVTWDRVLAVNLNGVARLTRALMPLLEASDVASVVSVASEAGLRGSQAGVSYTSSKHAVIGFTRHCAVAYLPKRIRFNAVAPGGVMTGMQAHFNSERGKEILETIAVRIAPPSARAEEIAASITWLLSSDSPQVNGVVLPADGGLSAI